MLAESLVHVLCVRQYISTHTPRERHRKRNREIQEVRKQDPAASVGLVEMTPTRELMCDIAMQIAVVVLTWGGCVVWQDAMRRSSNNTSLFIFFTGCMTVCAIIIWFCISEDARLERERARIERELWRLQTNTRAGEQMSPAETALVLEAYYPDRGLFPSMNVMRQCPHRRFTAYNLKKRSV